MVRVQSVAFSCALTIYISKFNVGAIGASRSRMRKRRGNSDLDGFRFGRSSGRRTHVAIRGQRAVVSAPTRLHQMSV